MKLMTFRGVVVDSPTIYFANALCRELLTLLWLKQFKFQIYNISDCLRCFRWKISSQLDGTNNVKASSGIKILLDVPLTIYEELCSA